MFSTTAQRNLRVDRRDLYAFHPRRARWRLGLVDVRGYLGLGDSGDCFQGRREDAASDSIYNYICCDGLACDNLN